MKKIAIFISGEGSNAQRMISYFAGHQKIKVACLISSKENVQISTTCKKHQVRYHEYGWNEQDKKHILDVLKANGIDWIVLAGFLKKIPESMIRIYSNKIINLHPSLLPKYGGKGMYGMHVHRAVIEGKEKESGITIHYVNEEYDKGKIIQQFKTPIQVSDDADSLFEKIRQLETNHFTQTVENEILNPSIRHSD
jgi:phosphoribosylglycinamide formyltransferase-1